MEIWKDVEGYEGLYQVSDMGRVKSLNYHQTGKEAVLKARKEKNGYLRVVLCKEGKMKNMKVHRLVCQAFLPNPHNYPEVNHRNEIKTDNKVENLEWCDRRYNNTYGENAPVKAAYKASAKARSKPVHQFTKDGEFVAEYPSTREAERQTGIYQTHISKCCLGRPKYLTAGGYIWKYVS